MSAVAPTRTIMESVPAADPAPLGLAGFAMTTFLLSGTNASFIPDLMWVGFALFYGGLAQFCAGMWEFRNRNVFGATAFGTYGGFWMGIGIYVVLAHTTSFLSSLTGKNDVHNSLAWFILAFAIVNFYLMLGSLRINLAVLAVFVVLEATEIVLAIGYFNLSHGGSAYILHVGGWLGVVDAGLAWYTSASGVLNPMFGRTVVPVGKPLVPEAGAAALA